MGNNMDSKRFNSIQDIFKMDETECLLDSEEYDSMFVDEEEPDYEELEHFQRNSKRSYNG